MTENLTRRDALKMLGAGAVLATGASATIATKAQAKAADLSPNIAIIGAGMGGITLSAQLIKDMPNAKITLFDRDETFYYQPGFTLIGAGIYNLDDVTYDKKELINEKVAWIKKNINAINPENNELTDESGEIHKYDILVIATGVEYDYDATKGLSAEFLDADDNNVATIYQPKSSLKAQKLVQKIAQNGGNVLFSEQRTPNKCGGANKKLNFMLEDLSRQKGTRDKLKSMLYNGGGAMLGSPIHAKEIEQLFIKRDMPYGFFHNLIEVDTARNVAVFQRYYNQEGEIVAGSVVEKEFEYLFMMPRMKAQKFITDAGLAIEKGDKAGNWVNVDKFTMQSPKFPNVFAIGDCAGIPKGKTGASIRKQYPVIAKNIISVLRGETPSAKFNGYTACPLLTRYGKAIMVEFGYDGALPSLECFGETRESWMNWFIKVYLMKAMVMKAMIYANA